MDSALKAQTEWTRAVGVITPRRLAAPRPAGLSWRAPTACPGVPSKRFSRLPVAARPCHPPHGHARGRDLSWLPPAALVASELLPGSDPCYSLRYRPNFQVIFDQSCAVQASAGSKQVSPADMQVGAFAATSAPRAPTVCSCGTCGCEVHPLSSSFMRVRFWQVWATAFNDKDTTFGNGINISGANYEVHRFYEEDGELPGSLSSLHPRSWPVCCRPLSGFTRTRNIHGRSSKTFRAIADCQPRCTGLIYGRTHSVDPREGEGFCLARANKSTSGSSSRSRLGHAKLRAPPMKFRASPPAPALSCARVIKTCNGSRAVARKIPEHVVYYRRCAVGVDFAGAESKLRCFVGRMISMCAVSRCFVSVL